MERPIQITVGAMVLLSLAAMAQAAEKEKTKSYPHYWMSVATSNQSIPGMPSEMSGIAGLFGKKGGFGPRRELHLQLESPQAEPAKPQADHEIPPGQNMGKTLPLVTPKIEKVEREPVERGKPEQYEKPKARMLIYWGCGETIGKGQPRVIDTATMSPAEFGRAFAGRSPTHQTPPTPHKGWTYGEWPNNQDKKDVPKDSSLVGAHLVKGNYLPDIGFSLDSKRDFMAPVEFSSIQATAGGATKVEWQSIPTAIGYLASAIGHDQKTDESIFWSSSEVPEIGFGLQDYLTPGDVSRFIKEKVVMPPTRTSCTVPPIFKDAQGAMLRFIAYGEELNLIHPPRPKDPHQAWNPLWSVKVRLKSTGMTTLMAAGDEGTRKSRSDRKGKQQSKPQDEEAGETKTPDSDSGLVPSPVKKLKGLFGF